MEEHNEWMAESGNGVYRVIDSHVHFWEYKKAMEAWITNDMKLLRKNYLPAELKSTLARNGVAGCIAVQADQSELETHFLVELSETYPFIEGVVGWIDLRNDNIERRLAYFSQYKIIKGWRHIVQAESAGFLNDSSFRRGIEAMAVYDYVYDLLIYSYQLEEARSLVESFPAQQFILNHAAKPAIGKQGFEVWTAHIKALAQNENVSCKLSGLLTEAEWKNWSAAAFYPYLDILVEAFGTRRLLFGSDWPVMLLSGYYVQWKSLLEKYFQQFSEEDRMAVFGGNAIRIYQL